MQNITYICGDKNKQNVFMIQINYIIFYGIRTLYINHPILPRQKPPLDKGLEAFLFYQQPVFLFTAYIWCTHGIYAVHGRDIYGSRTAYMRFKDGIYAVHGRDICGSRWIYMWFAHGVYIMVNRCIASS